MLSRTIFFLLPLTASLVSAVALPSADVEQASHALDKRGQNILTADSDDVSEYGRCIHTGPAGHMCCWGRDGKVRCSGTSIQPSENPNSVTVYSECDRFDGGYCCRRNGRMVCWSAPHQVSATSEDDAVETTNCHIAPGHPNQRLCCSRGEELACRPIVYMQPVSRSAFNTDTGDVSPSCWRQGRKTCCTGIVPPPVCWISGIKEAAVINEISPSTCWRQGERVCCNDGDRAKCFLAESVSATEVEETSALCHVKGFQTCCWEQGRWVCRDPRDHSGNPIDVVETIPLCHVRGRKVCCPSGGRWACHDAANLAEEQSGDATETTAGICQRMGRKFCCWINGGWSCQPYAIQDEEESVKTIEASPGQCFGSGGRICCLYGSEWRCKNAGWRT